MKPTGMWVLAAAPIVLVAGAIQAEDSVGHSAAATRHSGAAVSQGVTASGKAVAATLGTVTTTIGVGASIVGAGSMAVGQSLSRAANAGEALQVSDETLSIMPPSEALKTPVEQPGR